MPWPRTRGAFLAPEPALFALTLATILMVSCVQLGFRARAFPYSADEVAVWWPEPRSAVVTAALQRPQAGHFARWLLWSNRARQPYKRVDHHAAPRPPSPCPNTAPSRTGTRSGA